MNLNLLLSETRPKQKSPDSREKVFTEHTPTKTLQPLHCYTDQLLEFALTQQ